MPETFMLYHPTDIEQNRRSRVIFFTWYFALMVIIIAALVIGFVMRYTAGTIAATIVGGAVLIFLWDYAGSPVNSYAYFLRDIHAGLHREDAGRFLRWGDVSVRDGLFFYEMHVLCGEEERVYFVDARKELPALNEGDAVTLTTHNKAAIVIERA